MGVHMNIKDLKTLAGKRKWTMRMRMITTDQFLQLTRPIRRQIHIWSQIAQSINIRRMGSIKVLPLLAHLRYPMVLFNIGLPLLNLRLAHDLHPKTRSAGLLQALSRIIVHRRTLPNQVHNNNPIMLTRLIRPCSILSCSRR